MSFQDHFSGFAASYAAHRPRYPAALFELAASLPEERRRAWDCGTGNGQAALGLAPHFSQVIATDASETQLSHATSHPNVEYRIATAEASGLADGSVDLVAVAAALHWFDLEGFYREARRVLAPGGAVMVWTYNHVEVDAAVDRVVRRLVEEVLAPYWPPGRQWVNESYRTLPFPFAEIALPEMEIVERWNLAQFLGYLHTWSAVGHYRRATGREPGEEIAGELTAVWGDPEETRLLRWPLFCRAGR
jgi:ubiquinone/menaquinone biosynthesis C-methylase UbiE